MKFYSILLCLVVVRPLCLHASEEPGPSPRSLYSGWTLEQLQDEIVARTNAGKEVPNNMLEAYDAKKIEAPASSPLETSGKGKSLRDSNLQRLRAARARDTDAVPKELLVSPVPRSRLEDVKESSDMPPRAPTPVNFTGWNRGQFEEYFRLNADNNMPVDPKVEQAYFELLSLKNATPVTTSSNDSAQNSDDLIDMESVDVYKNWVDECKKESSQNEKKTSTLARVSEIAVIAAAAWVTTEAVIAYKNIPQKEWDAHKGFLNKAALVVKKTGCALYHRPGQGVCLIRRLIRGS